MSAVPGKGKTGKAELREGTVSPGPGHRPSAGTTHQGSGWGTCSPHHAGPQHPSMIVHACLWKGEECPFPVTMSFEYLGDRQPTVPPLRGRFPHRVQQRSAEFPPSGGYRCCGGMNWPGNRRPELGSWLCNWQPVFLSNTSTLRLSFFLSNMRGWMG